MQEQILNNRYKLQEELVRDPLIILFKAQDLHDNKPVLVTLLTPKAQSRSLEVLLRFRRSAEQVLKLNHPNLLKVFSIGESEQRTYLVQEYFEGQPLVKFLNQPWDADKVVELILQIASTLEAAHQQNLLHQAIKPAHILISQPALSNQPAAVSQPTVSKLYNFGYSILQDISRITDKEEIISTFGYLSPESSGILRKPIDSRSDIYSLGILFYQLLTGRLPYIAEDVASLIYQHIATKPVSPSQINSFLPTVLDSIVLRLIAKEPQERYQSLTGLIIDLKEYQRQRQEGRQSIAFEIARSDKLKTLSFSTRLIGRKSELNQLKILLSQAAQGKGSLCFVKGEPGIGKSRIVDEVRGYFHELGGLFVGGKCYQYELRVPYRVWGEIIDAYIEKIKRLSRAEQEACTKRISEALGERGGEVVKIAPQLTELIGIPPKPMELEPEKEKIRFLITVSNFILSLGSKEMPLLLFLDHMHWVDDASVEILKRISEKIADFPIAIIVSYRDNEVDSHHPLGKLIAELKGQNIHFTEIALGPFSLQETALMVSQILMSKGEDIVPLADFLNQRTKGNPFFILELLHSLVESRLVYLKEGYYTYDLGRIKETVLPDDIVDIILKRMKDLSLEEQQLLSYAAVMGKEIQFELLAKITKQSSDFVLNSVEKGIGKQFLVRDIVGREKVFFMHSRIREAFCKRLTHEGRIALHRHIGNVLEEHNKNNIEPVLYDLTYHFTEGYVQDKALQYSIIAAHKAKSSHANTLAVHLFSFARDILERNNQVNSPKYIEVLENLGEAYRFAGRLDEAVETLKFCDSCIPRQNKIKKAQVLSKIGDTLFDKGEVKESIEALEKALKILNVGLPDTRPGLIMEILKEFMRQVFHMQFADLFVRRQYKATLQDFITVRTFIRLVNIYYFSDMNKVFYLYLKALNLAEKLGPCPELAYCYNEGTAVWSTFPWFNWAFLYGNKGLKMSQQLGDRVREGSAYAYLALYAYVANNPVQSLEYAQKAINLLKDVGEYWDLGVAYTFRNYSSWITGRLQESLRENQEFIAVAKEANALRGLGWAFFGKGKILSLIGEIDDATLKAINEFNIMMSRMNDKPNTLWSLCILAFVYLRKGDYSQALQIIKEAGNLFSSPYNKTPWLLDCFPLAAQIYLDIVVNASDLSKEERAAYLGRAGWFCRKSAAWGSVFQFFLPWALQVNGTYLWLTGQKKAAILTWEKAIKFLREKTVDKYRLAYVLLEEAKFLLRDDPKDKNALGYFLEAKELFGSMGCKLDLQSCNKLLETLAPEGIAVEPRQLLTQKRHLDSLLSVTQAIGSIFIPDELLQRILEYALKVTGAERGFLLLYDQSKVLSLKVSRGLEKDFSQLSFSYDNYKISLELINEVGLKKTAAIADQQIAPNVKIQAELKNYQVRQAIAVPLQTRDKPLGILYLDNRLAGGTFGKDELELMKSFAVQASVSIENAYLVSSLVEQERLKQELELGRQIQNSLLPKRSPTIEGLKVVGLTSPAKEIGGDYFDFVSLADNRLGVVIGDVSGKGVAAGLLMAMAKTAIRTLSQEEISPKQVLIRVNNIIYQDIEGEKFMTMLYLVWEPQSRTLHYSSAGHEHLIVYRAAEQKVEIIMSGGLMLGTFADISEFLEDKQIVLKTHDKVILYTDGITEARDLNEKPFTMERLVDLVKIRGAQPAEQLLHTIKDAVYAFIGTREQFDDITLVVMEAT